MDTPRHGVASMAWRSSRLKFDFHTGGHGGRKEDDPDDRRQAGAARRHDQRVQGVLGVLEERWREAHTVRHCALSLVGEPTVPRINELIGELHAEDFEFSGHERPISRGDRTLRPVTQLYVEVDAPNKDDLRRSIDRCSGTGKITCPQVTQGEEAADGSSVLGEGPQRGRLVDMRVDRAG